MGLPWFDRRSPVSHLQEAEKGPDAPSHLPNYPQNYNRRTQLTCTQLYMLVSSESQVTPCLGLVARKRPRPTALEHNYPLRCMNAPHIISGAGGDKE